MRTSQPVACPQLLPYRFKKEERFQVLVNAMCQRHIVTTLSGKHTRFPGRIMQIIIPQYRGHELGQRIITWRWRVCITKLFPWASEYLEFVIEKRAQSPHGSASTPPKFVKPVKSR